MHSFIENWRCIESGFEDGPLNMAIDEMLLASSIRTGIEYPVLRFYGFRPDCVTFGVNQRVEKSDILKRLKLEGVKTLTRRPTGGGVVYHDFDLCYTLVLDTKDRAELANPESAYEVIHQAIFAGFRREGIDLELASEGVLRDLKEAVCNDQVVKDDLLFEGRKMAGAAERWRERFLLHQGFISLKPFVKARAEYFQFFERIRGAVQEGFRDRFGATLTVGGLHLEEAEEAVRLKNEKYATEAWNFRGSSQVVTL